MAKTRRGAGEGSITERADGRWMARLDAGYNAAGKRIRKTVYGSTKTEVLEKLDELRSQRRAGTLIDAGNMTVAEWLDHWFERIAKPKLRKTTQRSYESIIRNHLTPQIGRVKLAKLTPINVQAMLTELEDKIAPATLGKVYAVLRKSLNVALRQGMVIRNVCNAVEPPKARRPEMKTLTADQVGAFLTAAETSEYHALFVLAVTTGLRQGELLGLQWGDLNVEKGTLSVRRALIELPSGHEFGPPKSEKSRRTIGLPKLAVTALLDHRAKMFARGLVAADRLLFVDRDGGPIRKSNFQRRVFKPLLKAAEVPDVRFHDLRHTSATLMLADGVHPKIVQQRLGHSQISLTLDTYSHVLPEMDQEAASTFDRVLPKRKA